uniref:Uncharacterized protein n=1 Tax=Magnetococcus massalia (strain MO-1) TaxID=451514 RepID=A0A1S7LHT1_MAGMO|nr:protein of unknown function [Candidatus Magnetococcus massalia]
MISLNWAYEKETENKCKREILHDGSP